MSKGTLFIVALLVILVTGLVTLFFNIYIRKPLPKNQIDAAVNQAKLLYRQKKQLGEDLSNGPCLSNALMPGWVADLVHSPRLPADDLPENQCPAYREGGASHFVELDLEGELVRVR